MLKLLYQDNGLRVYDKPANIALLADRTSNVNFWQSLKTADEKPYLVHRLDKGTSGVLLIARSQAVQSQLTRAFAAQALSKFYLAWVTGAFPPGFTHRIELPLCKGRKSRYRVAGQREDISRSGRTFTVTQDREGLAAVTLARVLGHTDQHSLMLLKPLSGRTHQLRVHMSWLGFPIMGDHLYGRPADTAQQAPRLMLHCHRIVVPEWGRFTAPAPASFRVD